MKLRLLTIAEMVPNGKSVADIGTDHGFLPIELVKSGKVPFALAMDVVEGPLNRAKEHIHEAGLNAKIECRLSDGFDCLNENEVDVAVIAGMGGDLISDIISRKPHVVNELIVSPHTHYEKVRRALRENQFRITDERMILDADKYYVIIKAVRDDTCRYEGSDMYDYFGRLLIERKDEVLYSYLKAELLKFSSIEQKRDYLYIVRQALSAMR